MVITGTRFVTAVRVVVSMRMVAAKHVWVIKEGSLKIFANCRICFSGYPAEQRDPCFSQSGLCTAANPAADQHADTCFCKEAGKRAVSASVC